MPSRRRPARFALPPDRQRVRRLERVRQPVSCVELDCIRPRSLADPLPLVGSDGAKADGLWRCRTHGVVWLMFLVEVWIPISNIDRVPVGIREGYVIGFFRTDDVAHFDAVLPEASRELLNRFV